MDKKWEELTQAEKTEDLRKDIKATMATLNSLDRRLTELGQYHNDLMNKHSATASLASEVGAALRALEEKVAKLGH